MELLLFRLDWLAHLNTEGGHVVHGIFQGMLELRLVPLIVPPSLIPRVHQGQGVRIAAEESDSQIWTTLCPGYHRTSFRQGTRPDSIEIEQILAAVLL